MNEENIYLRIGVVLGFIPAIITFFGGWWYCTATYGFLFGFGLGWLPSLIMAAIVFLAIMLLWGLAVLAIGGLILVSLTAHSVPASQENSSSVSISNWTQDEPTAALNEIDPSAGSIPTAEASGESEARLAEETYSEYDARRDSYGGAYGRFAGKGCTVDCGGHAAGYQWAEQNGIIDPDQCGGKSWSFIEGCRAYADENQGDEEPE